MKKKVISLLLIAMISSTALISCGKTENSADTNKHTTTTEQSSENASTSNNSKIVGENNKPTIDVKQIAAISDFKDKTRNEIEKLLGKAISEDDAKSVYEKDDYNFEITYLNSKCNEIKITPKVDMKFPADGANILNSVGIKAGDPDNLSPAGMEWDSKFDTYKINVTSDNKPDGKISYATIILNDTSK